MNSKMLYDQLVTVRQLATGKAVLKAVCQPTALEY